MLVINTHYSRFSVLNINNSLDKSSENKNCIGLSTYSFAQNNLFCFKRAGNLFSSSHSPSICGVVFPPFAVNLKFALILLLWFAVFFCPVCLLLLIVVLFYVKLLYNSCLASCKVVNCLLREKPFGKWTTAVTLLQLQQAPPLLPHSTAWQLQLHSQFLQVKPCDLLILLAMTVPRQVLIIEIFLKIIVEGVNVLPHTIIKNPLNTSLLIKYVYNSMNLLHKLSTQDDSLKWFRRCEV